MRERERERERQTDRQTESNRISQVKLTSATNVSKS